MPRASVQRELLIRSDNRVGLLAEITRLLSNMGIRPTALCVRAENSGAEVRLITDVQDHARDALRQARFQVDEREVVVLEIPNRAGLVCRITEALARKGIDIEDLMVTVSAAQSVGLVVFTCSHNAQAASMLSGP